MIPAQEFVFVALDIYRKRPQNRNIENRLDGWLTFLISDEPEDIIALIEKIDELQEECQRQKEENRQQREEIEYLKEQNNRLMKKIEQIKCN